MKELEQKTVSITSPEVSVLWLQDNALWLVAAALVAWAIWCFSRKK